MTGFVPPPYPYDRLDALRAVASGHDGGVVDLSVGDPCDPPSAAVVAALASSNAERGYPPSVGSLALRTAARDWMRRRFDVDVPVGDVAACVGSKEFVATTAHWLRLRSPERDTVLYPAVAYPTYEMGAVFAGCRAVPVSPTRNGSLDLASISADDARRAVVLWSNSPANPTGALDDLGAVAEWGRRHGVPVVSDECYAEFTWADRPRTILEHGASGVLALHSLSKRSNLAGLRVAFYAGDPGLVEYLREVRKHAGLMVPGPAQAAGVVALADDDGARAQRDTYRRRLESCARMLAAWSGLEVPLPAGGFYLWFDASDGWTFAERLATQGGAIVSPGDFYGAGGSEYVRVAVVQPDERLALVAARLGV